MPLIYFSPIQFSTSSILAIAALIKPYGQGIGITSIPRTLSVIANLPRALLQAVVPNTRTTLLATAVSPVPTTPTAGRVLLVKDNTAALKLQAYNVVVKKLTSLPFTTSVTPFRALSVSPIPDNVQEFSAQVASLLVRSTSVRATTASILLDNPST